MARAALRLGAALTVATALLVAGVTSGAVIQQGSLRVTVLGQIQPYRLPRAGTAPIAVFVSGHIRMANGSIPPQLERLTIYVNRHGRLDGRGLPVCQRSQVEAVSTNKALAECSDALVGSGRFWASIVLPDQRPFPTRGRLLVFYGRAGGRPVVFAHIYTTLPFASSFLIPFSISKVSMGRYGTRLTASLPEALGTWGYVSRIKLTLHREYRYLGRPRSFFNAGCPAPTGWDVTSFRLARAVFGFATGTDLSLTVTKACAVER